MATNRFVKRDVDVLICIEIIDVQCPPNLIMLKNSHEMRALKAQAALCFEEYCEPDEFCCMAAMFDPRYKSLKFAPPETREKAIDMLERLVALELDESMKVAEGTCTLSSKQPQSKKVSRFSKFKDSKNQSEIVSEVEKYRMYPFPDVDDDYRTARIHGKEGTYENSFTCPDNGAITSIAFSVADFICDLSFTCTSNISILDMLRPAEKDSL
ncbi:hypothetical protein Bhyg_08537, partial [Pseudolycoriella hygida]